MAAPRISSAPLRKVERVQFGLLSPEEIIGMSVAAINVVEMKENGKPKLGGLLDPRMGPVERDSKCSTCNGTNTECPGHFGHIELSKKVLHVGLINKVLQVLKCVCFNCAKLRIPRDHEDMKKIYALYKDRPQLLLQESAKKCGSVKMCGDKKVEDATGANPDAVQHGCQAPLSKSRRNPAQDHYLELMEITQDGNKVDLEAERVWNILSKMADEDCVALGFNPAYSHPKWMVITVLPVPPLCVRPSVEMNETQTSHDDLTFQLSEIIKANQAITTSEANSAAPTVIREYTNMLQFRVATLFDNALPRMRQSTQKSGRPIKAIAQRLKGKEGRVRGNLMGKRVDFSARTVITPDPNLAIDQVGVPRTIANNLTFPERVTSYNIERLTELVRRGHDEYPGAKYVVRDDGQRVDLRYNKKLSEFNLQVGYVVERHVVDDDVIVFNRQPTLHKMSMMGHRIKVLPWSTFRMNLSVTTPYNADFDGDEMNLHVPQSQLSRAEIVENMMVHKNIISPQHNRPVMGIVQDTLAAACKMTRRDTFIEKAQLMTLLFFLPTWKGVIPTPAILKPKELWTGKQLFSLIVPERINLTRFHSTHNDKENSSDNKHITYADTKVVIENGQLLSGIICKKSLGASTGSLIHIITLEQGTEVVRQFFGNVQTVINNWLLLQGQSMGVKDTIADRKVYDQVKKLLSEAEHAVAGIIEDARKNNLKPTPGNTLRQTFEQLVNAKLNEARQKTGEDAERSLSDFNNFKALSVAGSKGSSINISQVIACVGQQNVEGKRIPFGFRYRTLPHFVKDDYGPHSKGFVFNSYLSGLTPSEFFFHAMGGREGLIDTAVKTATTGYVQRRLVKAMEGLTLHYDGSIRNSNSDLLQLLYGEDSMDGGAVEDQTIPIIKPSHTEFRQAFYLDVEADKETIRRNLTEDLTREVLTDPAITHRLMQEFQELLETREQLRFISPRGSDKAVLPVNLDRLIWNAQKLFRTESAKKSDLNPVDVIEGVRGLLEKLVIVEGNDPLSVAAQGNATLNFNALVKSVLSAKSVLTKHKLTKSAFSWVLGEIEQRFHLSRASAGEMVGVLAAECLGEPLTQMTLNTFHHAGVSSKNVTLGVPRLVEIINVSRAIRTPAMVVYLKGEAAKNSDSAKKVLHDIELCTLRQLTLSCSIIYDPDIANSVVVEDRQYINELFVTEGYTDATAKTWSRWTLRIEFDQPMLEEKDLMGQRMELIKQKITTALPETVVLLSLATNAPLMRILINNDSNDTGPESSIKQLSTFREMENFLMTLPLLGLEGIPKVYLHQPTKQMADKMRVEINAAGKYESIPDWLLETDGSSLRAIMANENVDPYRTMTNDVYEACHVFGIEAGRTIVLKEMKNVIDSAGTYVNYRHVSLLCDIMTTKGYLMAISRHGVNRQKVGALMRCSFEETVDILLEASAHAETDHLWGVSENIMLGNVVHSGTGFFDLYLNEPMLQHALSVDQEVKNDDFFGEGPIAPTPQQMISTPDYNMGTPMTPNSANLAFSPDGNAGMSPRWSVAASPGAYDGRSPGHYSARSPGGQSPRYNALSPSYAAQSPSYSPGGGYGGAASPGYSPTSPSYSPTSPSYSPTSPSYSPTSPSYSPTSPNYSPTSPSYSPTSPSYSPTSPSYSPTSPSYSPTSPSYSPTSPSYSPTSPSYSPTSPSYSPASPNYSPTSPSYSPTSPSYSPTSPSYSPTSPSYSPSSPNYSPSSPTYSPSSPTYSPSSPTYSPSSPTYSPSSPTYSPSSPSYSPSSPSYSPAPAPGAQPPQPGQGQPGQGQGHAQGQGQPYAPR